MFASYAWIRLGGLLSGSGSPVEIDWYRLLALPELSSTGDFGPGFNPFNHAALGHLDLGSVNRQRSIWVGKLATYILST